jgi:hypothetical protein
MPNKYLLLICTITAVTESNKMLVVTKGTRPGFSFGSALRHFAEKKLKCPKEPRPNLPNVLRFYDQIGRRLSVFLTAQVHYNDYTVFWVATFSGCSPSLCEHVKKSSCK